MMSLPANARRTAGAALLVALAGAPALAQKNRSEASVQADVDFARSLAADWGFVDLAEQVMARVEQDGVPEPIRDQVALARCDVYAEGAARVRDASQRDQLYERAIECYDDFIYGHPYAEDKALAEAALVQASTSLGRSLSVKIEDATGEEAAALRKQLQDVLQKAVELTGELIESLEADPERTEAQTRRLYALLFNRGSMLLEIAKTQDDGFFNFEQSARAFENLVYNAGEDSPWGLRGMLGLGENFQARLLYDDAIDYYAFVVDFAIPRDRQAWSSYLAEAKPTPDELNTRFLFVQMGMTGLVESLRRSGRADEAASWCTYFINRWKQQGLTLQKPLGDLALLAIARTLLDAGGFVGGAWETGEGQWYATKDAMVDAGHRSRRDQHSASEVALSLAQEVNRDNRGNVLQIRAQKVISDVISRPGVTVSPDVLFEAAQGEYFDRNYAEATRAFKRVLASLDRQDDATKSIFAPKALNFLGRSLQRQDRDLEAALVFKEAYDKWRGDPEFDPQNADGFYRAISSVRSRARDDTVLNELWRESERAVQQVGQAGADEIAWRQADRAYRSGDFEQALDLFGKVPQGATSYEKALVFRGVSLFKMDDHEGAAKVFDEYLGKYLVDPVNTTTDPLRLARRAEARATAEFYNGLIAFEQARRGEGDWQTVLKWLDDFDQKFPDQTEFAPAALYRALIAHLSLNDLENVRRVHGVLIQQFGDSPWTAKASIDVYKVLDELREKERAEGDQQRVRELTREMARFLAIGNEIAGEPSFVNLRQESKHWMELQEWAQAETVLRRLVSTFGGEGSAEAADVQKFVLPDLGKALIRQQKVDECARVLKPLVDQKIATRETGQVYALALCGWAVYDEEQDRVVEIPGVGGSDEVFDAGTQLLAKLEASETKWTPPWYELKFDQTYAWYQWGQIDGKKLDTARSGLNSLSTQLGRDFAEIEDVPTRKKFLWLQERLQ